MNISFQTSLAPDDKARWVQYWLQSRHAHPEQHPRYAAIEHAMGRRPLYVIGEEAGHIRALALLSLKPWMRDWHYSMEAICRRGPVFDEPWAGRELLLGIVQRLSQLRVGSIRISSDWIFPGAARAEVMLREMGFVPCDSGGARAATGRIDLRIDPDDIFAGFSSSTRREIRLAGRRGIEVRPVKHPGELHAAYHCLIASQRRAGLMRVSKRQFDTYYHALVQSSSLGTLLGAFSGDELLGELAVTCSPSVAYPTMYSIHPARARRHANVSVGPSLWWQGLLWARERGCGWFDVEGSVARFDPSDVHYEISNFKRRFNPEPLERLSEHVLVCDPSLHRLDQMTRAGATLWKKVVKWLHKPAHLRRGHSDVRAVTTRPPPVPTPA